MSLSKAQIDYLTTQPLGRLATVRPDGAPQNNPVGFQYNAETGTIDIGGRDLPNTRKFRNIESNNRVAFVVDDLASVDPWRPRMLEIRGEAEALADHEPPRPGFGRGIIRIRPHRVISFGLDESA